jgi:hypothetical protein
MMQLVTPAPLDVFGAALSDTGGTRVLRRRTWGRFITQAAGSETYALVNAAGEPLAGGGFWPDPETGWLHVWFVLTPRGRTCVRLVVRVARALLVYVAAQTRPQPIVSFNYGTSANEKLAALVGFRPIPDDPDGLCVWVGT